MQGVRKCLIEGRSYWKTQKTDLFKNDRGIKLKPKWCVDKFTAILLGDAWDGEGNS